MCNCGQSRAPAAAKQGTPARNVQVKTVRVLDHRYGPPRVVERQVVIEK